METHIHSLQMWHHGITTERACQCISAGGGMTYLSKEGWNLPRRGRLAEGVVRFGVREWRFMLMNE